MSFGNLRLKVQRAHTVWFTCRYNTPVPVFVTEYSGVVISVVAIIARNHGNSPTWTFC